MFNPDNNLRGSGEENNLENDILIENKEVEVAQEKPDWKKRIEEETGEPYDLYSIKGSLEMAKDSIKKGSIISSGYVEEYVVKKIKEARDAGVDLSSIDGLDEQVARLQVDAPNADMDSYLKHIEDIEDFKKGDDEEKFTHEAELALRSWYFHAEEFLENNKGLFDQEKIKKIREKLDKTRKELVLG